MDTRPHTRRSHITPGQTPKTTSTCAHQLRNPGDGGEVIARYLGKIQLEMARQDLKSGASTTGKTTHSRSPWQIGLDAASTGDTTDTARWVEYLKATKGRNVVTQGGRLAELYGTPTDEQLDQLIGDDEPDDQTSDNDQHDEDVASSDSEIWNDLVHHRSRPGTSTAAAALAALETGGPQAMAHLVAIRLAKPVDVTTHPETGLPHLRYRNLTYRRAHRTQRRPRDNLDAINLDSLGPTARAWYGATTRTDPGGHP